MNNIKTLAVLLLSFFAWSCPVFAGGKDTAESVVSGKAYVLVATIKEQQKKDHGDVYASQSKFSCVYVLSAYSSETNGDAIGATRCEDVVHVSRQGKSLYSMASIYRSSYNDLTGEYTSTWTRIDPAVFHYDETKNAVHVLGMTWTAVGYWSASSQSSHWRDSLKNRGSGTSDSLYMNATTSGVRDYQREEFLYEFIQVQEGDFRGRGYGKG
jgi:hypothetical protein